MTGLPGGAGGELGAEARALLDAARDGLSPDPAAVRRVHARVHAATAGAAAGTALGVKLGIVGLIAALAVGVGLVVARGPARVAAPASSLEVATPVVQPERHGLAGHPATAPESTGNEAATHKAGRPVAPTTASDEDLITIETPSTAPARAASPPSQPARTPPAPGSAPPLPSQPARTPPASPRRASASPVPAAASAASRETAGRTGISLGREVELVDLAMAALRRGDAEAALRVMQEYAAEAAGSGQLIQDAAAIEIEALCRLRYPAARDKLAAFDARFPRSAQRARLEAACR